ncbi:MAG TPA: SDR family oxidoreductase, partial [Kribbella sp.]
MESSLAGKVALVAGASRAAGRGIAVQLGAAGATVYVTGRTTRSQRSEMDRPETIEETAALVDEAGGHGIAVQVDHLVPDQVRALVDRIESEQGALHVLVNDIWGLTTMEWDKSAWESSLDVGLRTFHLGVDTHAITSHFAIPLMIKSPGGLVVEMTDGTDEYNATNYRVSFFYDLAKAAVSRMAFALAHELQPHGGTAVLLTPGWLRSEAMLDGYGVTESNWRDATKITPHFAISESPAYVGRAVAALAQDAEVSRWNGKSLSSGQLAKVYGFTDLDGSQ